MGFARGSPRTCSLTQGRSNSPTRSWRTTARARMMHSCWWRAISGADERGHDQSGADGAVGCAARPAAQGGLAAAADPRRWGRGRRQRAPAPEHAPVGGCGGRRDRARPGPATRRGPVRPRGAERHDARGLQADRSDRAELGDRARPGRVGHREGGRGTSDPSERADDIRTLRRRQLCRDPREPARERVVRARERLLHGGDHSQDRPVRAGRRRHPVSRRDCRHEPGVAGKDPARGPGAGDRAGRGRGDDPRQRTPHRRDQSRPQGGDQAGTVSRGLVLPAGGRGDPPAAARRAWGRPTAAHLLLRASVRRAVWEGNSSDFGPSTRPATQPCVGGERPRAAQRRRAGGDRGHGRRPAGRASPRRVPRRGSDAPRPLRRRVAHAGGGGGAPHRAGARANQWTDRRGGRAAGHPPQYVDAKDEGVRPVTEPTLTPVRVEKALGLLPEIEALEPLRALLVSISRPDERTLWSSSGPYLTLGKRGVQPEELRHRMPQVFHTITEHLQGLYGAYVEALECQQRADGTGAVAALLRAGRSEERVARLNQARAWYDVALRLSQGLQDRRPEVESLRSLGELFTGLGQYAEAARHFQRALAIAEAEFDQAGAGAAGGRVGAP